MPLRDHFRPPVSDNSSWEEVHGGWPMVIVQQLGKILPERYVAVPRVHLGTEVEVDVASFERSDRRVDTGNENQGGIATAWTTKPTLVVQTDLSGADEYEVRVYDTERHRRLVAAVELISPRNKDRPESRRQFVAKCAALLQQRVAVAMVDVVTNRASNLYGELLAWVGEDDPGLGHPPSAIYSAACRWHPRGSTDWLEAWHYPLEVGKSLPVLPLWLTDELAIPLDLETSYDQTCRDLRIQ